MFHIIYKTTNLINNKIYIGKHSTDNINDNYLGSGTLLIQAIEKYGKHNFIREIVHVFENELEAYHKELEIVNENFISRDDTYNMKLGGLGGPSGLVSHLKGKNLSLETRRKMMKPKNFSKEHLTFLSENARRVAKSKKGISNHKINGTSNPMHRGMWVTPVGTFETSAKAAIANKCNQSTVVKRCKNSKFPDWTIV